MRMLVMAVALAAAVLLPGAAYAHEGHVHKVLGTIERVQANQIDVKATDGKLLAIVFDAKTAITRGKAKLDATALKVGDRVSVDYTEAKKINTATPIKLGESPARK